MRADLHLHTERSDGLLSAVALGELAAAHRLRAWAVTDHDVLDGAVELAGAPGLIAGVEVTAADEQGEVHVVGLGVRTNDPVFQSFLADIRSIRVQRIAAICAWLTARTGWQMAMDAVMPAAARVVTRSHLAEALVRQGLVSDVGSAFRDWIGDHALAACDRLGSGLGYPSIAVAAAAIQAAGGVALLAHPGLYGCLQRIEAALDQGLDGAELNHPRFHPALRGLVEHAIDRRGLLASCGSDLHRPGHKPPGSWPLSERRLRPLLERVGWQDPGS